MLLDIRKVVADSEYYISKLINKHQTYGMGELKLCCTEGVKSLSISWSTSAYRLL